MHSLFIETAFVLLFLEESQVDYRAAVSNTLATSHMWLVGIYFVANQSLL